MPEISLWELEHQSGRLLIHFDVKADFLSLDTFIDTAESARKIIAALDQTFFHGTLEYELVVLPPERGSFLAKFGLVELSVVAGSLFAFVNSEVGSAYIEGLTGKPSSEWAREIGTAHRDYAEYIIEKIEAQADSPTQPPDTKPQIDEEREELSCGAGAKLLAAMTRGILEIPTDRLEKIGMDVGNLPEAMEARADFYTICIEDREIKRIGFTPESDFPIPRSSFPERAARPERKEKGDDPPEWTVNIEEIYVTSPQWDENDQKARQWKGKDSIRRDCYFIIEDEEFWHRVRRKELHVEVLDKLKVQWACQMPDGKPRNRRVLRVLEFNGDKLAEPLTPDAIKALLGDFSARDLPKGQPSLFDE